MPTPSISRLDRPTSPPQSISSQAFTISQQQKLNVVTRVAIEGKTKQGQDGASIKMYLKISLPLESVVPGMTLALFPEENIKILTSQVHPIDANSAPYNFSSATCPLLHNAARALNLPARSSVSYMSNFGLSHATTSMTGSSSRTSNAINPPPLDDRYTGHILVTGYNVSYVLPKEFPRFKYNSPMDNEADNIVRGTSMMASRGRRASVVERNVLQFMAAIDMWVPYLSRPPRAPYLLSIPTPRCLSNHVKLRIFPPSPTSASFASLSSAEDDGGTWDLTADPHVTRNVSRLTRTNSYSHFADDESSDSSTVGFSDGYGIRGTFPSAERLRVRWATPLKSVDVPNDGDGRRRVGVREAKAEMTCVVLGKGKNRSTDAEGIVMNVEYKGTCKGVWFPGVATLLGMDIGLEAKGSDVTWVPESEPKWSVGGGLGFTGFDTDVSPGSSAKEPSTDSGPQIFILPSSPPPQGQVSRQNSTSSTSSLLRAPLPAQNVPDYSFEGSGTSSTPSGTVSSIGSLPPSSTPNIDSTPSINGVHSDPQDRPPGAPITIHVNMNDLLPPSKNVFTFTISGTIIVTPRPRSYGINSRTSSPSRSDPDPDPDPIVLPHFTVLAADAETTSFLIRNEVAQATVEVYNSSGDIRDAQTRKTVLQKGGFTRCGSDGGRIALRSFKPPFGSIRPAPDGVVENGRLQQTQLRPPSRVPSPSNPRPSHTAVLRHRRDGPLMIPYAVATVTPLLNGTTVLPNAHAVRLTLPAPCNSGSEWLEFGFLQRSSNSSSADLIAADGEARGDLPRVHIAGASVDGVPVRFETSTASKQEPDGLAALGGLFAQMSGRKWVSWVKVHIGGRGGGNVVVDYMVTDRDESQKRGSKGKGKSRDESHLNIFLPTFSLPVGRLEVHLETGSDLQILSLRSNFSCQQDDRRFLQHCVEELFHPWLSLTLDRSPHPHHQSASSTVSTSLSFVAKTAPTILSLILLLCLIGLVTEIRLMKQSLETCSTFNAPGWDEAPPPETVTITSTLHPPSHSKWWFGETTTVSFPTSPTPVVLTNDWIPRSSSAAPPDTPTSDSAQMRNTAELSSIRGGIYDSLLPFNMMDMSLYPWLTAFELPPPVRIALDKVLEGLGVFWQVVRRVYHYPLDPPN